MTSKIGLGLRTGHFTSLLKRPQTRIAWFEAITENFIHTEGAPLHVLTKIREHYPIALHGVALSIGSVDGVRIEHLKKIKALADRIDPFQISDHFCFSRFGRQQYHELLPLPLTQAMARQTIRNVDKVQSFLKRPLILENISAYTEFPQNEMDEAAFINFVARESGCKILLDLNNIYVNAANFRFNARRFLTGIDPRHVAQYHLAGFTDLGTHLFDTHAEKIHAPVLRLYREAKLLIGDKPVSLERDDRIPAFRVLEREITRTAALAAVKMPEKFLTRAAPRYPATGKAARKLTTETQWQRTIYTRSPGKREAAAGDLTPRGVQNVYRKAYEIRLGSALTEKFIRLREAMSPAGFAALSRSYVKNVPSAAEDLGEYGNQILKFLKKPHWPAARCDLIRTELYHEAPARSPADLFAQKVKLSKLLRFLPDEPNTILYRDHFAVKTATLGPAACAFIAALQKPRMLKALLAAAENENRLSAAQVKRVFRILGLPGILQ